MTMETEATQPREGWPECTPGYTDDLTNAEYHAAKWAVSSSYLKTMLTRGQAAANVPVEETPAMRLGTAVHTHVLEDTVAFLKGFVTPTDLDLRTKAGKEWKAKQVAAGREILSAADYQTVTSMDLAVRNYRPAVDTLTDAPIRERSIFWQDRETGIWCRCRPDAYGIDEDRLTLVDLKTCRDLDTFEKDAYAFGYDIQLAFYLRGLHAVHGAEAPEAFNAPTGWLIAVEKTKPYRVGLFRVEDETLSEADQYVSILLEEVKASGWFGDGDPVKVAEYRDSDLYTGNRLGVLGPVPRWVAEARTAWEARVLEARTPLADSEGRAF